MTKGLTYGESFLFIKLKNQESSPLVENRKCVAPIKGFIVIKNQPWTI